MVIQKEAKRQQDEAEQDANQGQMVGNSAAGQMSPAGSGGMKGETIEYVNDNA